MALLTTERRSWHCGDHAAEPNISLQRPIPPIPYYQHLLFSMARGSTHKPNFVAHPLAMASGLLSVALHCVCFCF